MYETFFGEETLLQQLVEEEIKKTQSEIAVDSIDYPIECLKLTLEQTQSIHRKTIGPCRQVTTTIG